MRTTHLREHELFVAEDAVAMTTVEPWLLAEGVSAITPDRLKNLVHAVERTRGVPGDMAELGVYKGGSAKVIATVRPEVTLHLFDTFEGLPYTESEEFDPNRLLKEGDFAASLGSVKEYLSGLDVFFHNGRFPSTFNHWDEWKWSFVHIDCDLGEVAQQAITCFERRLNPGGILYFDDYGCDFTGVTRAVDAAFAPEHIEKQFDMYGNQIGALVVKR